MAMKAAHLQNQGETSESMMLYFHAPKYQGMLIAVMKQGCTAVAPSAAADET
jgi:hypothetical protein